MGKYYSIVMLSILIVSCGGGGGGGPTPENTTERLANINKFVVNGTSSKNKKGEVVINPAENDGKWSIDWDIDITPASADAERGANFAIAKFRDAYGSPLEAIVSCFFLH